MGVGNMAVKSEEKRKARKEIDNKDWMHKEWVQEGSQDDKREKKISFLLSGRTALRAKWETRISFTI